MSSSISYLTYTSPPPPRSGLRCQPMGTWTGAAGLSSPASQFFPPFIAPLVLRSTPQRYIYQTSIGVFATHLMAVFRSRGGGDGRWTEGGGRWGGGGRVRQARSRPYPFSCFIATELNCAWTSISASRLPEPSDWGRCWLTKFGPGVASLSLFYTVGFVLPRIPSERVQRIGSRTQLGGGGIPMVPVRAQQKTR